jgi:aspartyl-tRNA(Asn)/glutamyl-tRNA(Gln) amidotransferase subunit A
VQAVFDDALRTVEAAGATLVEVEFPDGNRIFDVFGRIQRAEALFTHERAGLYPARRDEYGLDVLERLELATKETLSDYLEASAERQRIRASFASVFRRADVLLTPVSAGPALPIGDEELVHEGRSISLREFLMGYTTPQDLAGLPACAVRAGFDALGLPVGVQFTGPPWTEAQVLRAAQAFFEATAPIQARWPDPAAAPLSDLAPEGRG